MSETSISDQFSPPPKELKCFLVYSSDTHFEDINIVLSQIEKVLIEQNFSPIKLGEDIRNGEYYLPKLKEIIRECVLGVIILNGFRPNVVFEFGYLLGNEKPIIALQTKNATINIKTLFHQWQDSNLTERQFNRLRNPKLVIKNQLSDYTGIHISYFDYKKPLSHKLHPSMVLERDLEKNWEQIFEEVKVVYSQDFPFSVGLDLIDELLYISKCYFNPSDCDVDKLLDAYNVITQSASDHSVPLNIRLQTMVASTLAKIGGK